MANSESLMFSGRGDGGKKLYILRQDGLWEMTLVRETDLGNYRIELGISLASCQGKLYIGGKDNVGIICEISEQDIIIRRYGFFEKVSLAVHKGKLYVAFRNYSSYSYAETGFYEFPSKMIRNINVEALASHRGKLYGAGGTGVFEIFEDMNVALRDFNPWALVSHNRKLYDGGVYGICETFGNKLLEIKPVETNALASFEGKLYAGGSGNGIRRIDTEKSITEILFPGIYGIKAFTSIDDDLFQIIARKAKIPKVNFIDNGEKETGKIFLKKNRISRKAVKSFPFQTTKYKIYEGKLSSQMQGYTLGDD